MKEMIMWDKYDNKYRNVVDVEEVRNLEADLYEANNKINDLLNEVKQKDKIIDLMANALKFVSINDNNKYIHFDDTESIKKYFEERCNK